MRERERSKMVNERKPTVTQEGHLGASRYVFLAGQCRGRQFLGSSS